jgi:hypothetical protein
MNLGSVVVGVSAVPLTPAGFPQCTSPGSLCLVAYNGTAAGTVTIGPGSGITSGQAGPGYVTIPTGVAIPVAKLGAWASSGLYAISSEAGTILSWFYGTEISS